jgi:hypothetical protein
MATIRIPLIAKTTDALEEQVTAQLANLPAGCTPTIDRGEMWDRRNGAVAVAVIYADAA